MTYLKKAALKPKTLVAFTALLSPTEGNNSLEELMNMLVTIIDVISCENPECRDFARIIPGMHGMRSYYCPVCGTISYARPVDAALATVPQRFKDYMHQILTRQKEQSFSQV